MVKGRVPTPPQSLTKRVVKSSELDKFGHNEGELLGIDEKTGKFPESRVKDAVSLHKLYTKFLEADKKSARNRTILQAMLDGDPPWKDSVLQSTGMGWRFNLNFLEADTYLSQALTSYDDLLESVDSLILAMLKPNVVGPEDIDDVQDVINEEFTTLIREWSDFPMYWDRLATQFVGYGVGFLYWPDSVTWKWQPGGWNDFLMPRKTEASEEKIPILINYRSYLVHELWDHIKDSPTIDPGWDEDEVKKAIVAATKGQKKAVRWQRYWPSVESSLRNNDMFTSYGDSEVVEALHYWIREPDGSISFFMGLEDGSNKEFLYKDPYRYPKNLTQGFVTFLFGSGNGTYHSVRGMLWKIFNMVQSSNRMRSNMLDQTAIAGALLLQGEDGDSLEDMAITLEGPFGYVPAGAHTFERTLPNLGTQSMPVLNDLKRMMNDATGQFQPLGGSPGSVPQGDRITKYAIKATQESTSGLSVSSVRKFYRSIDRMVQEMFRRVQKIGPNNKRFPEVADFFKRAEDRGVESEWITEGVKKVVAQRAIGNGSPQMRLVALDELTQMGGELDSTGRSLATRDRISTRFGRQAADRYKPREKRIAPDQKVAELEQAIMVTAPLVVDPNDNHAVHLEVHVGGMLELLGQLNQFREENPEADFRPVRDQVDTVGRMIDHSSTHVQELAKSPLMALLAKGYNASLEQAANLLNSFSRQIDAQERRAQQDTQGGQEQMSEAQRDHQLAVEKLSLETDIKRKESEARIADRHTETMYNMRLKRLQTDSDLRAQFLKNSVGGIFPGHSPPPSQA